MKIRAILENISSQQRGVGQLPADFRPAQTSPQLNGPYPGRNATRGYLVGEDQDMSEGHADQQRKIFKKNGEPVGEVGIDRESSPGVGQYYMKHYASGTDNSGYDSFEDALGDLRHAIKQGVSEAIDIGSEWMSDTELDQYVPDDLQQEWRELVGYDEDGNAHPLWANMTGDYEPDVSDPQHRAWMVKVANKWFAMKKIPNVRFFDVRDLDDELEWLVQIGAQGVAEGGYNPLADERREQSRMDAERREFKRDELAAELGDEEQRAQQIMSGTWYIVIDGRVWQRGGRPVTFAGRAAARRAGQTIKNRTPERTVTITTRIPTVESVASDRVSKTNAAGVTQHDWMTQAQQQGARLIQAKMIDGPVIAIYPNGRRDRWVASTTQNTMEAIGDLDFQAGDRIVYGFENEPLRTATVIKIADKTGSIARQGSREFLVKTDKGEYEVVDPRAGSQSFDPRTGKPKPGAGSQRGRFRIYRVPDGSDRGSNQPIPGVNIGSRLTPGDAWDQTDIYGRDSETASDWARMDRDSGRNRPGGPVVVPSTGPYSAQTTTDQDPDDYFAEIVKWYRDATPAQRQELEDHPDFLENPDALDQIKQAAGVTGRMDESRDQHYLQTFREAVARGMTSEDVLSTMKRQLGDYLQDVAKAIKKDPDLVDKIPKTRDQIGPAVRTIKTDDGHEIRIHGNEDDGFRISIRNRTIPSRFKSLDEAEMATEMYCARRRQATQLRDDYVDEA